MAVSASRNWILTRDNFIESALRKAGVIAKGETPSADDYADGSTALNAMVQSWQNEGVFLWSNTAAGAGTTAATASITLSSSPDIIEISNVYWRENGKDTPLKKLTLEEYKAKSDKTIAGSPTEYYVDYLLASTVIYLYPVYAYATSIRTGSDSNAYACLLDHTSAAATYPITGESYTTYWEATSLMATGGAWVTATDYYSGHVNYTKTQKLQDFDSSSNNPDAPTPWYQALIYGLSVEMGIENQIPDRDLNRLIKLADYYKTLAFASTKETGDMRLKVRMK